MSKLGANQFHVESFHTRSWNEKITEYTDKAVNSDFSDLARFLH